MASIDYNEIYSRFFTRVEAYDLIAEEMTEDQIVEFLCNWLHASVYEPYIKRLFKDVSLNDDEKTITFELKRSEGEEGDKEYIATLLAYGMVYHWVQPKVNSITSISQMFSSSDSKWYSQASHLSELRAIRDDAQYKMRALVRDRGYVANDYLDGKAASANIRG